MKNKDTLAISRAYRMIIERGFAVGDIVASKAKPYMKYRVKSINKEDGSMLVTSTDAPLQSPAIKLYFSDAMIVKES